MMVTKIFQAFICLLVVIAMVAYPFTGLAEDKDRSRDIMRAGASVHLLDGMAFKGPTGEKGKKDHHIDILTFKKGIFTSSECFQFGFKGGPYTASIEGEVIRFQAETISPTHGKMVWAGTLKGETLEVDYSWTKERWLWTTHREYWFKGELIK